MLAVEHRYYGCHNASACPVPDVHASGALRFLSSRQALGDLASFHKHVTDAYGLTENNKWVSWGGSYPGMLAGWFRTKFPHLVHAAVSSSAPVLATLDMRGYYDMTARAYAVTDNNVGGSDACRQAIATGHAAIGQLMNTTQGQAQLAQQFRLLTPTWLANPQHQKAFAGNGVASFPAQGNDPSCTVPACNIKGVCQIMTNVSLGDEVARLAQLRSTQLLQGPLHMPQQLRRRTHTGARAQQEGEGSTKLQPDYWGYQTCTEFAFYQTCEVDTECFFTQGLLVLEDYLGDCKALGLTREQVQANVDYTNQYYGGLTPSGSRVLFPNGEVDPWSSLAIIKAPSPDLVSLWVPGASHHAWTHPTRPSDQPSVVQARALIREQVTKWLAM